MINSSYQMSMEANKCILYGGKWYASPVNRCHVVLEYRQRGTLCQLPFSNSYFRDKKTRQQFWQNANENLLNDFVVTLCYDDRIT